MSSEPVFLSSISLRATYGVLFQTICPTRPLLPRNHIFDESTMVRLEPGSHYQLAITISPDAIANQSLITHTHTHTQACYSFMPERNFQP